MLTSSVMLDMIIVVIVALLAWLGARHGLFRTGIPAGAGTPRHVFWSSMKMI